MYLFRLDATGRRFVAALSAAAARGVDVRVSLDGWGSSQDARQIEAELAAAGCTVSIHAWRWWFLRRALARNHRKLLLVDEGVAFVGGINVGDEYGVDGGAVGWADLAAELRGGACTRLARELRRERVREPQGAIRIHLANRGGGWRLRRRYLEAFRGARTSIQLAQGYFLPDRKLLVGSFNLEPLSLISMEALVEADDAGAAAQGERWMREHFALACAVEPGQLAGAGPPWWLRSLLATLLGWMRRSLERVLVRNRERLGRGPRKRS